MKLLTAKDRVQKLEIENNKLHKEIAKINADLTYLAMMVGVDLTQKGDTDNEQTEQTNSAQ